MTWARVTCRNSSGRDAGEAHEVLQRVLVGAPGALVAQVGEPLDFGRDVGELLKAGGGEQAVGAGGGQEVGSCGGIGVSGIGELALALTLDLTHGRRPS